MKKSVVSRRNNYRTIRLFRYVYGPLVLDRIITYTQVEV